MRTENLESHVGEQTAPMDETKPYDSDRRPAVSSDSGRNAAKREKQRSGPLSRRGGQRRRRR